MKFLIGDYVKILRLPNLNDKEYEKFIHAHDEWKNETMAAIGQVFEIIECYNSSIYGKWYRLKRDSKRGVPECILKKAIKKESKWKAVWE